MTQLIQVGDARPIEGREVVKLVAGAGVTITESAEDEKAVLTFEAGVGAGVSADEVEFDPTGLDVITEDNVQDALGEVDVALASSVLFKQVTFTEEAGAGSYEATVTLPDGSIIVQVSWRTTAAFDADTATLDIGITGALTAFGNDLDVSGVAADTIIPLDATAPAIIDDEDFVATLTQTGTGGTTGRATVYVGYVVPVSQAAVYAAE